MRLGEPPTIHGLTWDFYVSPSQGRRTKSSHWSGTTSGTQKCSPVPPAVLGNDGMSGHPDVVLGGFVSSNRWGGRPVVKSDSFMLRFRNSGGKRRGEGTVERSKAGSFLGFGHNGGFVSQNRADRLSDRVSRFVHLGADHGWLRFVKSHGQVNGSILGPWAVTAWGRRDVSPFDHNRKLSKIPMRKT